MENEPYVCKRSHVSHHVEAVFSTWNIIHRNSWALNQFCTVFPWKHSLRKRSSDYFTMIALVRMHFEISEIYNTDCFKRPQSRFQCMVCRNMWLCCSHLPSVVIPLTTEIHGHFPSRMKAYPSRLAIKPSSTGAAQAAPNKRALYFPWFQW